MSKISFEYYRLFLIIFRSHSIYYSASFWNIIRRNSETIDVGGLEEAVILCPSTSPRRDVSLWKINLVDRTCSPSLPLVQLSFLKNTFLSKSRISRLPIPRKFTFPRGNFLSIFRLQSLRFEIPLELLESSRFENLKTTIFYCAEKKIENFNIRNYLNNNNNNFPFFQRENKEI